MNFSKEALADFTQAITFGFENEDIFYRRGMVFKKIEKYEKALNEFIKSSSLSLSNHRSLTKQGETRMLLGQFDQALADFNSSILLEESDWIFYSRGIAHLKLKQLSPARADFQKAIELAISQYQHQTGNIKNIFNLALYYLANDQINLSKRAYQTGLKQCTQASIVREAIQDLKEFLKIFPEHSQGSIFFKGLCNSLEHQLSKENSVR